MSRELFDMECLVQNMIELLKSAEQEALVPSIVKCLLVPDVFMIYIRLVVIN